MGLCIVLSVITCGLYGIYWQYCLAEDMNLVSDRQDGTSGAMVVVLTLVTCGIYGLYWVYRSGDVLDRLRSAQGRMECHLGILYLVLGLLGVGIVSYALMQAELNEYAAG